MIYDDISDKRKKMEVEIILKLNKYILVCSNGFFIILKNKETIWFLRKDLVQLHEKIHFLLF